MNSRHGELDQDLIDEKRETMRRELLDHMLLHHRRRHARRRMLSVTTLFLIATLLFFMARPLLQQAPKQLAGPSVIREHENRRSVFIQIVSTRPSITGEYVVHPDFHVLQIDDQSLLENLVALNRPSGIVRSGDRIWLTSPVTDPIEP